MLKCFRGENGMDQQDNNQFCDNIITEIKSEIQSKINEMGYLEYRLSQSEKLRQFIEQAGWKTINGDKLLDKMEGADEQ